MKTIEDIFYNSLTKLKQTNLENPRLNCEIIISEILKISKTELYLNFQTEVNEEQSKLVQSAIQKRLTHQPIQYILGKTNFYECEIFVDNTVLIPRPETEYLVKKIIDMSNKNSRILDIGTGSGCIAIALKKNIPKAEIEALDISSSALKVAKKLQS